MLGVLEDLVHPWLMGSSSSNLLGTPHAVPALALTCWFSSHKRQ